MQGSHSRIQFTPDLLPSDVTGVTIYDQTKQAFEFHPGPIFATIVLADEINRASPKTQSALLEVMEEGRVTVDGIAHSVGAPFMVIATQNPIEQAGTYRLPEAQLDRFLMKIERRLSRPRGDGRVASRGVDARPHRGAAAGHHRERCRADERARRRGPRRPGGARLRQSARRGVAPAPAGQARSVGARLPRATCVARRRGRSRTVAATSFPTTSRNSPSPCSAHRLLLDAEAQFAGVDVGERHRRASCARSPRRRTAPPEPMTSADRLRELSVSTERWTSRARETVLAVVATRGASPRHRHAARLDGARCVGPDVDPRLAARLERDDGAGRRHARAARDRSVDVDRTCAARGADHRRPAARHGRRTRGR